ncbi:flagellar assembly protein FliW [Actinotalea subterranea]|uniref:flagellar assembly protein FliW n=1 Tax=Actinotalea subterranea TaxID=2607497 RepID=UPI0011ED369C|nr:flagellar assembly protein FliW [Actinotalea subterranea]
MSVMVADGPAETHDVHDVLEFLSPPPGLRDLRRFTLTALDELGLLFALRAVDEPETRLFLVPPRIYFPDYEPHLDPSVRADLEVADGADTVLLVVVHPGQDGRPPTANLLAPVVVDPASGRAVQVVLDGDEWPLRAPLSAEGSAA